MNEDTRCCGTGTCIIDKDGKCWCGQQWDGEKMCFEPLPLNDMSAKDGQLNKYQHSQNNSQAQTSRDHP